MSKYHNNNGPFSVAQIAESIGCEFKGDGERQIKGINALQEAGPDELAFLDNPKYRKYLSQTKAGAVIVSPNLADQLSEDVVAILSELPHPDYAKVSNMFYAEKPQAGFIAETAQVHETAELGENVIVEHGVVICEGAKIGNNVKLGANSYISKFVEIGDFTELRSNVTIECSQIGTNCLIHSGARIGQDGFGFAFDPRTTTVIKVPQVGGVKIGHYVEIGANTTIDRGSLLDTEIGDMTKIDNAVQIGHNVKLGRMCQIVSQVGIAGSTTLGDGCIVGGQAGIAGHLNIAAGSMFAAKAGVAKNISTPGQAWRGAPAEPINEWQRSQATLRRIIKQTQKQNKNKVK